MNTAFMKARRGFTLIELLTALFMLSLLALMSFRGLDAVLDARHRLTLESEKWQAVAKFFARLERDVQLAAPRPIHSSDGGAVIPAWRSLTRSELGSGFEFSRFAADEEMDAPQRIAYQLNGAQEIELWLWPGAELPVTAPPLRYPVLSGVSSFAVRYLNANLDWVAVWPATQDATTIPPALQLRIVLTSGEEVVRVFALRS
jgi:general secretion pathway protein J